MATEKKLPTKQLLAIALLLQGRSIVSVAQELKISTQSVDNYLRDSAFQSELNRGKDLIYSSIVNKLMGIGAKAVSTLESVLDDSQTPQNLRIRAAAVILGNIPAYRGLDVGNRLELLEKQLTQEDRDAVLESEVGED